MVGSWSTLFGKRDADVSPAPLPPESGDVSSYASQSRFDTGSLDGIGQQSENLREQVSSLTERLAELQTLSADFTRIVLPFNSFMSQHTVACTKLLEVEALLERERNVAKSARSELNVLQAEVAKSASEHAEIESAFREQAHIIRDHEAQIAQARIRINDLGSELQTSEQQLLAETGRARLISDENQSLRRDVDITEEAKARTEAQLRETLDALDLSQSEAIRLQQLTETLTQKAASLRSHLNEVEPQLHLSRSEIAAHQTKLAAEQAARQKLESAREAERSVLEVEIATLTMRIQGFEAHTVNTDKMLAHARDQMRGKVDNLRAAEKELTDLQAEKQILDRRFETQQESLIRSTAQMQETQRANIEIKERWEMLSKAMAAKDTLLDRSNRKVASLCDRIDELTSRFNQERMDFEASQRRLIEELQSEKSERSLAQGALDIARSSRAKVLLQYSVLKRQNNASSTKANAGSGSDSEFDLNGMASDNVTPFRSPE